MDALINGQEYSWSDVKINLFGRTLQGISAIDYDDNVNKKNNKGSGVMPVSRSRGDYEAKASITLAMKEVEAIQNALPRGKRLQDIAPFNIEVVYDPDNGNPLVHHRIEGCEFTNRKSELKAGEGNFETQFDLIVGSINWAA